MTLRQSISNDQATSSPLHAHQRQLDDDHSGGAVIREKHRRRFFECVIPELEGNSPSVEGIRQSLGALGAATGADLAYYFQTDYTEGDNSSDNLGMPELRSRAVWTKDSDVIDHPEAASSSSHDRQQTVPEILQPDNAAWKRWTHLLRHQQVICGDLASFPPEEQEYLRRQGTRSLLLIPTGAGNGDWKGVLGFETCQRIRTWDALEIQWLQMAGNLFRLVIEHAADTAGKAPKPSAPVVRTNASSHRGRDLTPISASLARRLHGYLADILGFSSHAADGIPTDHVSRKHLRELNLAAETADKLLNDFISFASMESPCFGSLNVNKLIEEALDRFQVKCPDNITCRKTLGADLWSVYGDRDNLARVLEGLIKNAIEAMSEGGGRLHIVTCNIIIDQQFSGFYERLQPGQHVYISVEDGGCGMDVAVQQRSTEPFYTTKSEGDGLGLSFADEVVRSLGGSLLIYSEPGYGSTVKIFLPATQSATENESGNELKSRAIPKETDSPTTDDEPLDKGKATVLMIDDDELVRTIGSEIFQHLGYDVITAPDGLAAIDIARSRGAEIDLVMLDLGMPIMPGEEVFFELKPLCPDAKIVICSGFGDDDRVQKLFDAGAAAFIQKPFRAKELDEKLKTILQ